MQKKTEIELQRAEIADTVRTLVRMKYRQAANREINNRIFDVLLEFDKGIQDGELLELPSGESLVHDLLGEERVI